MLIRFPEDQGLLYEAFSYPAGESQVRLRDGAISELFKSPEVQVLARNVQEDFMSLALLADAIHNLCPFVKSTLVLPYLPYSRADRRFQEGDCHGLKVFGEHLGSLRFSQIKTLDVHSHRAAKLVPNLVNVSARDFVAKAFRDICDNGGHPAILLPDEGAKGRYALDGVVQCSKKRDPVTGKLSGFEVPYFERKDALIVDDICDGGGTFTGLAEEINKSHTAWDHTVFADAPKKRLFLYVTHGIFSKGLRELSGHFEKIYTTNSIADPAHNKQLKVFDCEPLLLEGPK